MPLGRGGGGGLLQHQLSLSQSLSVVTGAGGEDGLVVTVLGKPGFSSWLGLDSQSELRQIV